MWKRSHFTVAAVSALACAATVYAQQQARSSLPAGPMQEKARLACLPCHDARIIVQQQLDRQGWSRNMDKMIRWGAPVPPEDREPLIDYFAEHFAPREAAAAKLAAGAGARKVRAACLGCHDARVIVVQRLTRRAWSSALERQIRWGATVRLTDREAILRYLVANYGPPKAASGNPPITKKP